MLGQLIKLDVRQVAFEKILQASEGRWQVWQEIEDMSISDYSSTMCYGHLRTKLDILKDIFLLVMGNCGPNLVRLGPVVASCLASSELC